MPAAAARSAPTGPRSNLAPLIAALAPVAFLAATVFRLPGAFAALIVLVAAALLSTPPAVPASSRKGEPEDARDAQKQSTHREWSGMRWRLLVPNGDWLPFDFGAQGGVLAWVRCSAAVIVGAALMAFSLPTAGTAELIPIDELAGSDAWLPFVNAIAAVSVLGCLAARTRRMADAQMPRPAVNLAAVVDAARSAGRPALVPFIIAALVGAVAAVGVELAIRLAPALDAWVVHGHIAAAGAWLCVTGAMLRAQALPAALVRWHDRIAAREMWAPIWLPIKVTPEPRVLDRRVYRVKGDSETFEVFVDELDAGAQLGANGLYLMRDKIAPFLSPDGQTRFALLPAPATGRDGQPVPGSVHPTRMRAVLWPAELPQDVGDPAVWGDGQGEGAELVRLRFELAVGLLIASQGQPVPPVLSVELASAPESERAAFVTQWNLDAIAPSLWSLLGGAGGYADTGSRFDAEPPTGERYGILHLGDLENADYPPTAPGGPISIPERFTQLDVEARWRQRWHDVLKMGEQQPYVQHEVYEEATFRGATICCQPFMPPQGIETTHYVNALKETKLASTLDNAPWVATLGWPASGRPGERHPGAFRALWCDSPLPADPSLVAPSTDPQSEKATTWILAASVNRAFDAAKLPRPEVVAAKALTARESRGHIWDITLRLYDGVTLAHLKKSMGQLRQGLGNTAWLRVTEYQEGARLVVGAKPTGERVKFVRRDAQELAMRLDWEQALAEAKVMNEYGQVPQIIGIDVLEKNPKVSVLDFRLPSPISRGQFNEARPKLMPATGNVFMDVRSGSAGADTIRVLAASEEPLPFPAPIDWDSVHELDSIPFAAGIEGEPVDWVWSEAPHLLLLGPTRSGKSLSMSNLLAMALIRGCEVFLADPVKFAADFRFAFPWIRATATTVAETSAMMDHVYAEVMRRKALNGEHGAPSYLDLPDEIRYPHLVVFIDEFASLIKFSVPRPLGPGADESAVLAHAELVADAAYRRNIGTRSGQIAREAGSAGVSLVIAGQTLLADDLKAAGADGIKANMASLLIGKVGAGSRASALKEPQNAPDLGEEIPKGRGIFETPSRLAFVVQSWYDAPDHTGSLAAHIAEARAPLEPSEQVDLAAIVEAATAGARQVVHGRRIESPTLSRPDSRYSAESEPEVDLGVVDLGLDDFDFGSAADPAATVAPAADAVGEAALSDLLGLIEDHRDAAVSPFGEATVVARDLDDLLALLPPDPPTAADDDPLAEPDTVRVELEAVSPEPFAASPTPDVPDDDLFAPTVVMRPAITSDDLFD